MKKLLLVFVAAAMLFSFSACGWKIEIVNPNDRVVESEAEIKPESEPEQTESLEEIPESYIKIENGKLSGKIHPMIDTEKGAEICKDELVSVSMIVPEGWEQGVLEEEGEIYGITFTMPWDNRHYANFVIYKDTGTTYDDLLAMNSLWVGIDEYTYHEVSGDFFEGSYIRFDYPRKNLGDEEDPIRTYSRFYQLKSEGYVVSANISIRLDEEWNAVEEDEKICDEFISSIKIG